MPIKTSNYPSVQRNTQRDTILKQPKKSSCRRSEDGRAKRGSHLTEIFNSDKEEALEKKEQLLRPLLVPTGIKAYMQDDEYLQLTNRSSNPLKNFIVLPNGVGIVDADYYNNEGNEGHIYFQFLNFGLRDKVIRKGDRIGQGIFLQFLKADQDEAEGSERTGGFGSSGQA